MERCKGCKVQGTRCKGSWFKGKDEMIQGQGYKVQGDKDTMTQFLLFKKLSSKIYKNE